LIAAGGTSPEAVSSDVAAWLRSIVHNSAEKAGAEAGYWPGGKFAAKTIKSPEKKVSRFVGMGHKDQDWILGKCAA